MLPIFEIDDRCVEKVEPGITYHHLLPVYWPSIFKFINLGGTMSSIIRWLTFPTPLLIVNVVILFLIPQFLSGKLVCYTKLIFLNITLDDMIVPLDGDSLCWNTGKKAYDIVLTSTFNSKYPYQMIGVSKIGKILDIYGDEGNILYQILTDSIR